MPKCSLWRLRQVGVSKELIIYLLFLLGVFVFFLFIFIFCTLKCFSHQGLSNAT
ncbi:hypothetical protein BDZ91DRAFT_727998 [Kalaharituber pfeilii]|nr:hypothetical protein BDZ91DRAFT_727998 [Kalaharituber pfeilii]